VSLWERVLTTALIPVIVLLSDLIPLPFVDSYALGRARVTVSPLALGVTPFITAYSLVELAALIIPRIRRWRHSAPGRLRLERCSGVLAVALATVQAFGLAQSLRTADFVTATGWQPVAVHTATLTGGACAAAVVARWATQRGLVNGFVLWWTVPLFADLVRGKAFHESLRLGGSGDVLLLGAALAVAVVVTGVALAGGEAIPWAARIDGVAYRDEKTAAPRAWFPIPLSSIWPLTVAPALLSLPALLVPFHVPGMEALQSFFESGTLVFYVADVVLVVLATFVAVALLYRPAEVSAFIRRLGTVSDETARTDAESAMQRALGPTVVYLLALVAASAAAHGHSAAVPTMASLAVLTGLGLDLVSSARAHVRARDLVGVGVVHDAYAVAALRAALLAEGIDAQARGMAVLSLLQAFGAYAPAEIYVRPADAERASALLRHWAAGEAKPVASVGSAARGMRVPWSPELRAAVIAGLGGVALVMALMALWPASRVEPPARRAEVAIVRVDDVSDPLRAAHAEDGPEGFSLYSESVPLEKGHYATRYYARMALRDGESLQAAWARLEPWLREFPPPSGDRWAWEAVTDAVQPSEDDQPVTFRIVGLRTLVLTGDPVVTTRDIEFADVGLEDHGSGPPYVSVTLNPEGAERFYGVTKEWLGRRLAIVVDGAVSSAPYIKSPIPGGHLVISMGNVGSPEQQLAEAKRLAAALR
jgi:preprotein translocase subunit SecY